MITREWKVLATAVMFLTRIPVGRSASGESADLAASTQYFPLIGLLVGVLVSIVFVLTNLLWSSDIAVALCLVSAVLLTGGFHEDGIADVADSAGAWTQEQKLDVMRDSRVGTYGALALVFIVLLKYLSLSGIAGIVDLHNHETSSAISDADTAKSVWLIIATLVLAHVLGRWSTLPLIRFTPYAREHSSNKVFAEGVTDRRLLVGSLITLVIMIACAFIVGIVVVYAFASACVVIALSRQWFMRSVGGITGDCLGAANQVVEVGVYLCVAAIVT